MKYNKNVSLRGNIHLLKNKIENKVRNIKGSEPEDIYIPRQLEYRPKICFIIMGEGSNAYNSLINQSYVNIVVTKIEHYNFENNGCDYVCFVNSTDTYYNNAVYNMVESLQNTKYDILYSDEDISDKHFYKPDWSPDTLKSINYVGNVLIKAKYIKKFQDYYSYLIEMADRDINVYHISKPLYKSERKIAKGNRVLKNINGKVSIIIPSKDNYDILKRCIDSIRKKTDYKNYEIIVVDNGSADREKYKDICDKYIYGVYDFNFSKMCNIGAKCANGEYLLFLNDDTEVITSDWLNIMAAYSEEKNAGAIGAKLYYPDSDIIQHCGVCNIISGPVHYFNGFSDKDSLYFGRNRFTYNVSAVTAACMLIKKDIFLGFDENFTVGYNDVDLCFSLIENGYNNMIVNDVKLYHYESLSRGDDRVSATKLKRLAEEKERLYNKHKGFCCNDRFYNVNLTLHRADFSVEKNERVIPKKFIEIGSDILDVVAEYIYVRENTLFAGGYINKKGTYKVYIEIEEKEKYIAKANTELRQDIAAIKGKGYSLSGFSAVIDISRIRGKYNIYLIAVNSIGKSYKAPLIY